jgi:pimeloyl-ACP methyl ester carboxylesterase
MKEGVQQYHIKHLRALVSKNLAEAVWERICWSCFTDTDSKLNSEALKSIFEALEVKNLTPRLGELRMPVLTLNGEFDGTLLRTREMTQKIPGAVHQIIPGAGHACCLESPIVRPLLRKHGLTRIP